MSFGLAFALPASRQNSLLGSILNVFQTTAAPGWLYDDSRMDTLYQDSSATTPVTALEQPVGLQLDLSQGLVLGAERLSNNNFASASGWTQTGTGWTVSGNGKATCNGVAASEFLYQTNVRPDAFGVYQVIVTISNYTSGTLHVSVTNGGDTTIAFTAAGTYTVTSTSVAIGSQSFYLHSNNFNGSVSFVSLKSIAGNHRYQPTSANRPTWSARYNLLIKTEKFNDAAWTATAVTPTDNAGLAPDGTTTAASIIPTTANSTHTIAQTNASNPIASNTGAIYAKQNGYVWVLLQCSFGGVNTYQSFNLATGAKGSTTGGAGTFTITPSTNGFYKLNCVATTASAVGGTFNLWILNADSLTGYAGDGTSGVYLWHPDYRPSDQATGLIPTYQRVDTATSYDSVGFPAGLRWNGSNSWMQNASNAFNSTGQTSLFVGVRKVSTAAGMITETSANGDSTNGTFQLFAASNASNDFTGVLRSTNLAQGYSNTVAPPSTNVVSMAYDITAGTLAGQIAMQINGVAKTLTVVSTATAGTVFSAQPAYFGSRAGSGYFFNGMTFSNIGIGGGLSASQIAAFNAWTNSKARAY